MEEQFLFSLMTGIFIGGVAGYLGSLMITKRMALVGDALGHVALPGVALALIYGFSVSLGAFPILLLGIILIWLFEMRTKLPMEALTGVSIAVLTIWDMVKSAEKDEDGQYPVTRIDAIRVIEKKKG